MLVGTGSVRPVLVRTHFELETSWFEQPMAHATRGNSYSLNLWCMLPVCFWRVWSLRGGVLCEIAQNDRLRNYVLVMKLIHGIYRLTNCVNLLTNDIYKLTNGINRVIKDIYKWINGINRLIHTIFKLISGFVRLVYAICVSSGGNNRLLNEWY